MYACIIKDSICLSVVLKCCQHCIRCLYNVLWSSNHSISNDYNAQLRKQADYSQNSLAVKKHDTKFIVYGFTFVSFTNAWKYTANHSVLSYSTKFYQGKFMFLTVFN